MKLPKTIGAADIYRKEALDQIPRLLSLMDRNPFSPTYGCADRTYWLDKAIDFPSSIMQYSVHSLALVYAHDFPGNNYYHHLKIKEWILASISFWEKIQKNDGSFDEFYPNERGWAGPTGFLLYAMLSAHELLGNEFPSERKESFFKACRKAALYLAKYDEHGILANHHAMALLPIYYASITLKEDALLYNFGEKLDYLLSLQSKEGWFLEYDGADLGYLSASISFLTKLTMLMSRNAQHGEWKKKIEKSIPAAIDFASYFAYPNGYYAGTMGSRQTLHFYPHGFEIWARKNEKAAGVADWLALGLSKGALVSPCIMPDRYVAYRVNEFLQSYLDAFPRNKGKIGKLPWQEKPFTQFFPEAKMGIKNTFSYYAAINLAKGGVLKLFGKKSGKLCANDCGVLLEDKEGNTLTSQWIDPAYRVEFSPEGCMVSGLMHVWVTELPTPIKMMALRSALITLGSSTSLAYKIKGKIRERIILKNKAVPISFQRNITWEKTGCCVSDHIDAREYSSSFIRGRIGDEFSIRYVPQSLYFQGQELDVRGRWLTQGEIDVLNQQKQVNIEQTLGVDTLRVTQTKTWGGKH